MKRVNIEALKAVLAEATPGPWQDGSHVQEPRAIVAADEPDTSLLGLDRDDMAIFMKKADAACCVTLHNAAPDLIAEVKAGRALAETVRRLLSSFHSSTMNRDEKLRLALEAMP